MANNPAKDFGGAQIAVFFSGGVISRIISVSPFYGIDDAAWAMFMTSRQAACRILKHRCVPGSSFFRDMLICVQPFKRNHCVL